VPNVVPHHLQRVNFGTTATYKRKGSDFWFPALQELGAPAWE